MQDAGINITEMNSGCICCSLVGDFGKALTQVISEYNPDRIVIEPSGVGKLSDVIAAVEKVTDENVTLDCTVAVVDAGKVKVYMKNFGEFYNNQIETAATIILSRTDMVLPKKLDDAVALLRDHNPNATIVTTPWNQLTGAQLMEAMEGKTKVSVDLAEMEDAHHHHHHEEGEHCCCGHDHHEHHHHHEEGEHCCCGHDHHHHHADEVFTSWGVETHKKFTVEAIREALIDLNSGAYGVVLRAKGIVAAEDGTWIHFDFVPGEMNLRTGGAAVTGKLCVIGAQLQEDKVAELFGV